MIITGTQDYDTLRGSGEADTIIGLAGGDSIYGEGGDDTLDGGSGDDSLIGGAGADRMTGGTGDDSFYVDDPADQVFEAIGEGRDALYASISYVLAADQSIDFMYAASGTLADPTPAELALIGNAFGQIINGNDAANILAGLGGVDWLRGYAGHDALVGGGDADRLEGGDGDDELYAADISPEFDGPNNNHEFTAPVLDTGAAIDTLEGGAGDDYIFAGYGDRIYGGANTSFGDRLYLSLMGASAGVTVDFGAASVVIGGGAITGIESVSWVEGSAFADTITGNAGTGTPDHSVFFGLGGDDRLIAGATTGGLFGGDGDDDLDGRASISVALRLDGGDGDDVIRTNRELFVTTFGGAGDDTIYSHGNTRGGAGNDLIILQPGVGIGPTLGEEGDDEIRLADRGAFAAGGAGADVLLGGAGNDRLASGDFSPSSATALDDLGLERDRIAGNGGNDIIGAGYGDDVDGGSGLDTLMLSLRGATAGVALNTAAIAAGTSFTLGSGTIQNIETLQTVAGSSFADSFDVATQATRLTVTGLGGNDRLVARGSAVSFFGGIDNDQFVSGAADDMFDGGAGYDTAVFDSVFRASMVSASAAAGFTITGAEGRDILTGVEQFRFADGTLVVDAGAPGAQIQRLYAAVLDRAPDQMGLEHWLDQVNDRGQSIQSVAASFLGSPEFRASSADIASNGGFVDFLYAQVLDRGADASGRAYWIGQLDAGLARSDALAIFSESAEHKALTARTTASGYFETDDIYQTIALLYDAALDRRPDLPGLTGWAAQVKAGTLGLADVAVRFAASGEFQARTAGLDNGALVDLVYRTTLDRTPDAPGRAFWVDHLDRGGSTGGMLLTFAQSAEHQFLYSSHIIGGVDVMG